MFFMMSHVKFSFVEMSWCKMFKLVHHVDFSSLYIKQNHILKNSKFCHVVKSNLKSYWNLINISIISFLPKQLNYVDKWQLVIGLFICSLWEKGCFATSLATQFLSCIWHLQFTVYMMQFITTLSQQLCKFLMIIIIMSCWRQFSSIHQNLTSGTMKVFLIFLKYWYPSSLWLFVLNHLGLWHMAQSKVAMWHINWILETNIYMYLGRLVHNHK